LLLAEVNGKPPSSAFLALVGTLACLDLRAEQKEQSDRPIQA